MINKRAASECEFYGHSYVGRSVCVYCGTVRPEQELQWAMQDLRIAADNLAAAERWLRDATAAYDAADRAVMEAGRAILRISSDT